MFLSLHVIMNLMILSHGFPYLIFSHPLVFPFLWTPSAPLCWGPRCWYYPYPSSVGKFKCSSKIICLFIYLWKSYAKWACHRQDFNSHNNMSPLTSNDPTKLTQGADFPGYEDRSATEDRKTRIRNSASAYYTPCCFLKHQYPLKTQWDSCILGFYGFKYQMEGIYIQNRAWFMLDPTFRKSIAN